MSFHPDPMQQLVLWRLAVSDEGGEFLKDFESDIKPTKRNPLEREQLIDVEKRTSPKTGRAATYLKLTDKGWAWCQNHLGEEFKSRSLLSTPILQRLLGLMRVHFEGSEHATSFGQFVSQARRQASATKSSGNGHTSADADLADIIRRTCRELANGQSNVRVRLADLRGRLPESSRSAVDQKLLEMEQAGELSLYRLDNPQEIQDADRDAVLHTATGNERHIVYFGG